MPGRSAAWPGRSSCLVNTGADVAVSVKDFQPVAGGAESLSIHQGILISLGLKYDGVRTSYVRPSKLSTREGPVSFGNRCSVFVSAPEGVAAVETFNNIPVHSEKQVGVVDDGTAVQRRKHPRGPVEKL